MTKDEREKLIQKLIDADKMNISHDDDLLIYVLRNGHKGYDHMTDEELTDKCFDPEPQTCDICGGELDEEETFCLNRKCPNAAG